MESHAQLLQQAGMSAAESESKAACFARCATQLHALGARAPAHGFFVPGRIEFLGKHTDYAGGRSLVCAVEKGLCVAVAPRSDRMIRVVDAQSDEQSSFDLSPDLSPAVGHWSNYPMPVARGLARNFAATELRGADIVFESDLPPAAGMSSSSALIVAMFLALSEVNHLSKRAEYRANMQS